MSTLVSRHRCWYSAPSIRLAFLAAQSNSASWNTIRFPPHVFDTKSFAVPTNGRPVLMGSKLESANQPVNHIVSPFGSPPTHIPRGPPFAPCAVEHPLGVAVYQSK